LAEAVRVLLAVAVVALLARAAVNAWRARVLAVRVWRGIRPRHVVGSLGLLVVVVGLAWTLLTVAPVTGFGLGSLVGLTGNVVFAPLDAVSGGDLSDPSTPLGAPLVATMVVLFTVLLALFPFLAYAEERTFRLGLEHAGRRAQAVAALRFGLAHLLMLVPVAAALAIGVAGYAYGRVYRSAYHRARAAAVSAVPDGLAPLTGPTHWRAAALLASTTWHATFNSVLVLLVLLAVLLDAFA
jgi:hypothetical protein